jgi:hypothetical protein
VTDEVTMQGVREYVDFYDVDLCTLRPSSNDAHLTEPRTVVRAHTESGDCTCVDLIDLIGWLATNRPELLHAALPQESVIDRMKRDPFFPIEVIIALVFVRSPAVSPENLDARTARFVQVLDLVGCTAVPGRVILHDWDTDKIRIVLHGWDFTWRQT